MTVAPNTPNALDIAWTGGACDASTTVVIESFGAALEVAVSIQDNGMPCDAMGLPQVIRLTFAEPLDPAMVKVTAVAAGSRGTASSTMTGVRNPVEREVATPFSVARSPWPARSGHTGDGG